MVRCEPGGRSFKAALGDSLFRERISSRRRVINAQEALGSTS
jgi:hypothetical protein